MSDLLSSFSIIIALIALFYSQWSVEIEKKITEWVMPDEDREEERKEYLKKAISLRRSKLYPLLLASTLFTLLLSIEVIKIFTEMIYHFSENFANSYFETVKAMVVFILFLILLIDWKLIKYTVALRRLICKG